jgi:short-subunit dehydrogenase
MEHTLASHAMSDLEGKLGLVTGASSGLGVEFARILAERGCHLVLVARREDRLQAIAEELRGQHDVEVHVIPVDLSKTDSARELYDRTRELGLQVDVLVNNAGFGIFGDFVGIPWEREREMLELDILTLVHLTKLFLKDMVARGHGYVLQVASIGAYQPSPSYATYSAAKSFVLHFGEAIRYELRGTGVKVSVVSPGVTATEFLEVTGQKPNLYQRLVRMRSRSVAEMGIRAMLKGKPSKVTGRMNFLSVLSLRLLPRRAMTAAAGILMKGERRN